MHFAAALAPLWTVSLITLVAVLLAAVLGWYSGRRTYVTRNYETSPPRSYPGEATMGAMIGLLGLLLAFTFGFAMNKAEARKVAQVEEAAAIGTAFLRADLLAEPGRTELREAIRRYAHTRVVDSSILTLAGAERFFERSNAEQARLWPTLMEALDQDTPPALIALVASGVTEVLDANTRRFVAGTESIPTVAKLMLLGSAATTLFFVGNSSALRGRRLSWRTFIVAGVLAFVMIVILDFERPRSGFIRTDTTVMKMTVADLDAAMAADTARPTP